MIICYSIVYIILTLFLMIVSLSIKPVSGIVQQNTQYTKYMKHKNMLNSKEKRSSEHVTCPNV